MEQESTGHLMTVAAKPDESEFSFCILSSGPEHLYVSRQNIRDVLRFGDPDLETFGGYSATPGWLVTLS